MNTYDPASGMVYRHLARQSDPYSVPVTSSRTINQLPAGYANGSPRTYLRRTFRPAVVAQARARR